MVDEGAAWTGSKAFGESGNGKLAECYSCRLYVVYI
jgi:hypothetical protein